MEVRRGKFATVAIAVAVGLSSIALLRRRAVGLSGITLLRRRGKQHEMQHDSRRSLLSFMNKGEGNAFSSLPTLVDPRSVEERVAWVDVDHLNYNPIKLEEKVVMHPEVLNSPYKPKLWDKHLDSFEKDWIDQYHKWVMNMHGNGEPLLYSMHPEATRLGNRGVGGHISTYYAIWNAGGSVIDASAWSLDERSNNVDFVDKDMYVDPREHDWLSAPTIDLFGCQAAFHGWWPNAYGHVLDYHLAQVAYLKMKRPPGCRFIFLDTSAEPSKNGIPIRNGQPKGNPLATVLEAVDPEFYSMITWIPAGVVVRVNSNDLTISTHQMLLDPPIMRWGANKYLMQWLASLPYKSEDNIVIYANRILGQAGHGRIMDTDHNNDILSLIQSSMQKNGRQERLVVFDGTTIDGDGTSRRMTTREQFELFRGATTLIGTHGTALANMQWMDLTNQVPNIIEFTIGPYEYQASAYNRNRYRNYFQNFWDMPFNYNHIVLAPNSTMDRTFIDLDVLGNVLDSFWDGRLMTVEA